MRPPECNCHGNQCLKHKNSVPRTVREAREAVSWANNALRKLTILSRMQPKVEPDCTSSTLSKTKIIFGVRKEYVMKCKKTLTTHPPTFPITHSADRSYTGLAQQPRHCIWPSGSSAHTLSHSKTVCGLGHSRLWGTPPLQGPPHCSCTLFDNYYNCNGFCVFILAQKNANFIHAQLIYLIKMFREMEFLMGWGHISTIQNMLWEDMKGFHQV